MAAIGFFHDRSGRLVTLVLFALFFSWVGDIFLQAGNMFIPGLASFLVAHIFYIIYFIKVNAKQRGLLTRKPLIVLPVLIYIIVLLRALFPYLFELKIAVIVYSITIAMMLMMAINTSGGIQKKVSTFLITGALLFVISDSLLAVNLFIVQHIAFDLVVMSTYAAAQFFLVKGAIISNSQAS